MIHFDGTAWSSVDVPLPDGEVQLSGIAARAPDDVWLFGYWSPKSLEPERAHVLALHWNGSNWRRLGLGSPVGSIRGWANDATVAPGGAIWLVGTAMTPVPHRDPIEHPMALELRRGAWTRHDPDPADSPFFSAVAFSSPNDGWTVGQIGYSQAVMEHWDGASWSIVPLRIDPDSSFEDVAAAPDGSVFAVGQLSTYFDDYGDAVYASVIFRRC